MLSFLHPKVGLETVKRGGQSICPSYPAEGKGSTCSKNEEEMTAAAGCEFKGSYGNILLFLQLWASLGETMSCRLPSLWTSTIWSIKIPLTSAVLTYPGEHHAHTCKPKSNPRTKQRLFEWKRHTRAVLASRRSGLWSSRQQSTAHQAQSVHHSGCTPSHWHHGLPRNHWQCTTKSIRNTSWFLRRTQKESDPKEKNKSAQASSKTQLQVTYWGIHVCMYVCPN